MTTNREKLVIEELSDGFAVRDMSEPQMEFHQWGFLSCGFRTREDAEQYIAKYIAEERAREERMEKVSNEPFPF